jgi:hypothetical protein
MQKTNNIISFISKFFKEETNKIVLGRWTINYCPISTNKKIDSGNHDHCGPCGTKELQNKYDDDEDDIVIIKKNDIPNKNDKELK